MVVNLRNQELRRTGLGIAADPLLVIENRSDITHVAPATLRDELLRLPGVKAVTAMLRPPFGGTGGGVLARSPDEDAVQKLIDPYFVSDDFAEVSTYDSLRGECWNEAATTSRRGPPEHHRASS